MRRWVIAAVAAGAAAGLDAGRAAPPRQAGKEASTWLPALAPAGPEATRSAVFSNACYEAWITTNGHLHVVLQKNGKPAGPPFRLFSTGFWGHDPKVGFSLGLKVLSVTAESKLPVRQPTTPVRFRFEGDKDAKGSVDISFEARSIVVDSKFRPSPAAITSSMHPAAWFSPVPGVKPGTATTNENLKALCEGRSIDLIPEKGETFSLPFVDDARNLPLCAEWVIRGPWDGIAVRGKVATRGQTFRLWQYAGTKPAEGFAMVYPLSKTIPSRKVTFFFESTDPAASPAGPRNRGPIPRPGPGAAGTRRP